jgi:hypothetical protein
VKPGKPQIGFIGAGRVANTLAVSLAAAGYPVVAVASRTLASAETLAARVPGCRAYESAQAVIDACAETGTWIELNCNPYRFDLDWRLWPYAKSKGVKCVINPDAHRNEHAMFLRFGAGIARKGWLEKKDVINTLPLEKLMKELKMKRTK